MLSRFTDFDRTLDVLDELRRQMDRVWDDLDGARGTSVSSTNSGPRLSVYDGGPNLVIDADVPGVSEKDVDLTLEGGVLTIAGERKLPAPEGFKLRRQERSPYRFSRSVALPCRVDAEKTQASVKDGVLTVILAKADEARPRKIQVRAQS